MSKIEWYDHHGRVAVKTKYKGMHRDVCLCSDCAKFTPEDRENNCPLANELYAFCVKYGGTAIRQECADFELRTDYSPTSFPSTRKRE
jgi:hypothetical protein